jgi:hypothetical protein
MVAATTPSTEQLCTCTGLVCGQLVVPGDSQSQTGWSRLAQQIVP